MQQQETQETYPKQKIKLENGYSIQQTEEWEIRIEAPSGQAWRIYDSADPGGFSDFIYEFFSSFTEPNK